MGRVLRGTNGGINLVNAVRGIVSNGARSAIGAAPSTFRVGQLLDRVGSINYRCIVIRISSRTLSLNEMRNLRFGATVFAGLARSRLSCRRGVRGCCLTGGGLFSVYSGTIMGVSGSCNGELFDRVDYGGISVSLGRGTSCVTGSLGLRTGTIRCVLFASGVVPVGIGVPNGFAICGSLYTVTTTSFLKVRRGVAGATLNRFANMGKETRIIPGAGSFAMVVSCTRAPSNVGGVLGAFESYREGHLVILFNYNNSHSGAGQSLVNRVTSLCTSCIVVADSGPHARRPGRVVSSVLGNISKVGPCGIVRGQLSTVGFTLSFTRGSSVVMLTNGKRRACRVVNGRGVRFSRHRVMTSALSWMGEFWGCKLRFVGYYNCYFYHGNYFEMFYGSFLGGTWVQTGCFKC